MVCSVSNSLSVSACPSLADVPIAIDIVNVFRQPEDTPGNPDAGAVHPKVLSLRGLAYTGLTTFSSSLTSTSSWLTVARTVSGLARSTPARCRSAIG